jgi:hypothetical protein
MVIYQMSALSFFRENACPFFVQKKCLPALCPFKNVCLLFSPFGKKWLSTL